jgi:hypothetical protein
MFQSIESGRRRNHFADQDAVIRQIAIEHGLLV